MNIRKTINAGIKIHILILSKYVVAEIIHHKANAQLSHMNTLAGLMLKNMKATRVATHIHNTVVARYLCAVNRATAKVINTNIFNHQANQSNQSVMFTAFTMNMVEMNVHIGNRIHR
jgi:hypothetical protein